MRYTLISLTLCLALAGCGKRVPLPSADSVAKALTTVSIASQSLSQQAAILRDGGVLSAEDAAKIISYCADTDAAVASARAIQSGTLTDAEKRAEVAKLMLAIRVPEDLTAKLTGPGLLGVRVAVDSLRLMILVWGS